MDDKPLVSVVVPCYNAENWIGEALYSICDQSYSSIEIIIVDDGSTDDSVKVARNTLSTSEIKRDNHIMPLITNGGACAALDIGFGWARGKYVCMLAADDVFVNPDYVSDVVGMMERTGADWCYNTLTLTGETISDARPIQSKWLVHYILDNLLLQFPWICNAIIRYRNPVNSSSLMFRRNAYILANLSWSKKGPRSVCDGVVLREMFAKGLQGFALHDLGCFYRIHDKQISNTDEFKREMVGFKNE